MMDEGELLQGIRKRTVMKDSPYPSAERFSIYSAFWHATSSFGSQCSREVMAFFRSCDQELVNPEV